MFARAKMVFSRDDGAPLPSFFQEDAPPEIALPFKGLFKKHGGLVVDTPGAGAIIIIFEKNSESGINLITRYSVPLGAGGTPLRSMEVAVLDYKWIAACISAGHMHGPPIFGGYYIQSPGPELATGPSPSPPPVSTPEQGARTEPPAPIGIGPVGPSSVSFRALVLADRLSDGESPNPPTAEQFSYHEPHIVFPVVHSLNQNQQPIQRSSFPAGSTGDAQVVAPDFIYVSSDEDSPQEPPTRKTPRVSIATREIEGTAPVDSGVMAPSDKTAIAARRDQYTQEEIDDMTMFLAENPAAFFHEELSERLRLWSQFAASHPQRGVLAYLDYQRRNHARLETAALQLMDASSAKISSVVTPAVVNDSSGLQVRRKGRPPSRKSRLPAAQRPSSSNSRESLPVESESDDEADASATKVKGNLVKKSSERDPALTTTSDDVPDRVKTLSQAIEDIALAAQTTTYSRKHIRDVIEFVADNPSLITKASKWHDATSTSKVPRKTTLWERFGSEKYPGLRNAGAWESFHRRYKDIIDDQAIRIIEKRNPTVTDAPMHVSVATSTPSDNTPTLHSSVGLSDSYIPLIPVQALSIIPPAPKYVEDYDAPETPPGTSGSDRSFTVSPSAALRSRSRSSSLDGTPLYVNDKRPSSCELEAESYPNKKTKT